MYDIQTFPLQSSGAKTPKHLSLSPKIAKTKPFKHQRSARTCRIRAAVAFPEVSRQGRCDSGTAVEGNLSPVGVKLDVPKKGPWILETPRALLSALQPSLRFELPFGSGSTPAAAQSETDFLIDAADKALHVSLQIECFNWSLCDQVYVSLHLFERW